MQIPSYESFTLLAFRAFSAPSLQFVDASCGRVLPSVEMEKHPGIGGFRAAGFPASLVGKEDRIYDLCCVS